MHTLIVKKIASLNILARNVKIVIMFAKSNGNSLLCRNTSNVCFVLITNLF